MMWRRLPCSEPRPRPLLPSVPANEGIQKRELSLASAAGQAVVGALCLWRGFKDDEVAGVATPKF